LLTVEEFDKLSWPDGRKRELRHGEIVEKKVARFTHEVVKAKATKILVLWAAQSDAGEVLPESEYKLDASIAYFPDLSFLTKARFAAAAAEGNRAARGAPELAIEVVSSEEAKDLETKIEDYLTFGSRAVWVLYPELRVMRVHDQTGASRLLRETDTLEDPELLPGFRVNVAKFFEGLPPRER